MNFRRSTGQRAVDEEWHEFRQRARETAFSLEEFGEPEKVKYNLDTARVTGRENPRSYTVDRPIETEGDVKNGTDIRTLDNR